MKNLVLVVAALAIPAMHVAAGDEQLALFTQLDMDKNGLISKSEAQKHDELSAMFEKLDADADGQLSLSEFEALVKN